MNDKYCFCSQLYKGGYIYRSTNLPISGILAQVELGVGQKTQIMVSCCFGSPSASPFAPQSHLKTPYFVGEAHLPFRSPLALWNGAPSPFGTHQECYRLH